jgi:hypothetical protein
MDFMANRTSLDPGGFVLVDKRPPLISMTLEALFLFKPSQPFPCRWFVRVVAGRAGQDTLLEAVALVELELGENILVAAGAVFVRTRHKKSRSGFFGMDGVTGRAVE